MMFKEYRIKRLRIRLAGLQGKYDELLRIWDTLEGHNSYYVNQMSELKKIIAEYKETLKQLEA